MQHLPISIVVVCDDHYSILLAVLLKSIEVHHLSSEPIEVYLVDDHISKRNKLRLNASVSAKKMAIHYIPIEDALPAGLKLPVVPNSYPLNTYIRLLIPHFLPAHITRVLFMDVDMIVQADISKLWHTDTGRFPIGAVPDSITRFVGNLEGGGIPNYKALGMQEQSPYFNAGLQLINIPVWKEQHLTEKIMQCIRDNAKDANMGDQYGLNVVLENNWFPLDPLWNYMANGSHESPYLIHFIHRKPFYKSYFNNPKYQAIFYRYLALTAWKGTRPVGEPARYAKKLRNVFQKAFQLF